jgi:hypothetical protein
MRNQRQHLRDFAGGGGLWIFFFVDFFFFAFRCATCTKIKATKDFVLGYTLSKKLGHSNEMGSRYMAYRKGVIKYRPPCI